ncbi:PTS transporter subunit EIIC, partial [Enterococcus faecium]|uniref:PTS transporter subunit EIIC n=1 Tax=Enterococcus faecium TaxID=1352 RepID=UPI00292D8D5B
FSYYMSSAVSAHPENLEGVQGNLITGGIKNPYLPSSEWGWQIKMPDGVPPAVTKSFAALIPAVVTLTIFLVINAVMTGIF